MPLRAVTSRGEVLLIKALIETTGNSGSMCMNERVVIKCLVI